MKLQNKLILLTSLFSTFGLIGCDHDNDSERCALTDAMCQSADKTLDTEKTVKNPLHGEYSTKATQVNTLSLAKRRLMCRDTTVMVLHSGQGAGFVRG